MRITPGELAKALVNLPAYTTAHLGLQVYRCGDPTKGVTPPDQELLLLDAAHRPMLIAALQMLSNVKGAGR